MKSHNLYIICDVINSSMNIEEHCQIFMISKKINVLKKYLEFKDYYRIIGQYPIFS